MEFDDFTIFDIFIKKEFVYMIMSINTREINENEITMNINSETLNFNSKIVRNIHPEPIMIFKYDKPNSNLIKNNIAKIVYSNIEKTKEIENMENTEQYLLTLTTLFKDDYNLFPLFYEYYKNQGVEHFYMYYNGIASPEIKKIFDKEDVILIEWNFQYWIPECQGVPHAQLGQMHNAIYKYGKDNSKYMIFCDLDEYMYLENINLKQLILNNEHINTFGFNTIWAKTIDDKIPSTFPDSIIVGTKYPYGERSKNIYKIDTIVTIGVHSLRDTYSPYWNPGPNSITDLNMFHFYNWSQPNRRENVFQQYQITK